MHRFVVRSGGSARIAAAAAVAAALLTAGPAGAAAPNRTAPDLTLLAADITIDLVRHGQSTDDVNGILGTVAPGAPLSDEGEQQAQQVAASIQQEFPGGIAGIYASELIRTQQSADPLADALHQQVQVLPGLDEVQAGILEGRPRDLISDIGYAGPMAAWILGLRFVPMLGATGNPNGMAFEEHVNGALDTIYADTTADADGPQTAVAYTSGGVLTAWTLMNVNNPDFLVVAQSLLENLGPPPNGDQVVLTGNPTDGWTLVSWNGHAVDPTPNPLIGLFVDVRDVIVAPQTALWDVYQVDQAGGDVDAAMRDGFDQVGAALQHFPTAVLDTLASALGAGAAESAADGLAGLI